MTPNLLQALLTSIAALPHTVEWEEDDGTPKKEVRSELIVPGGIVRLLETTEREQVEVDAERSGCSIFPQSDGGWLIRKRA